jgi:hypothetical protein
MAEPGFDTSLELNIDATVLNTSSFKKLKKWPQFHNFFKAAK